ncbi:MAG: hypothetical protein IT209_09425 [Armatimonadetes bacterium]|nr:hypothetical protein [Armatimonadota bacterium]
MNQNSRIWKSALILAILALCTAATVWRCQAQQPSIRLETRVLGQNQWLSGSLASVRILTINHYNNEPLSGVPVSVAIAAVDSKDFKPLFSGRTNSLGSVDAAFGVPEALQGSYHLRVQTRALGETDEVIRPVEVRREVRVLLTTDKPIYQPGQLMHIRALALKIPSLHPADSQPCTLEVSDARGNKVFKKAGPLSHFGIASADFQLASEVNQGAYTVRAIVEGKTEEKKVTVERYVLPKFKVRMETERTYYLPGDRVKGTVHADYFFGKPVENAKVSVKLSKFDVGFSDFAEVSGTTDSAGTFTFEQTLPMAFVGQPLEQGNAFFKIETAVTDGADHTEKVTRTVPVAKDPLKILAIPESGNLVAGIENIIYLSVSYPDGSPVKKTAVRVQARTSAGKSLELSRATVEVDDLGIGEIRLTPADEEVILKVEAQDSAGHRMQTRQTLSVKQADEAVLLRTDKAVLSVGEALQITALCSRSYGYVYLDVVKDGQTVLTKSIVLNRGRATLSLPLTADKAGAIQLRAYRLTRNGNIVRDSRTVFVRPASDLKIAITSDARQYLPGKPAKLSLSVTDGRGRPLAAALGISIVDESVYALQELQPGLERIYFMLEKELAEPKYEIHSITPGEIVGPRVPDVNDNLSAEKQQAARVLFAAVQKEELANSHASAFTLESNTYAEKIDKIRDQLARQAKDDWKTIAAGVAGFQEKQGGDLLALGGIHYLVREGLLPQTILKDQWGSPYEFISSPWGGGYTSGLALWSNGPDRRKGTVDDIVVSGYPRGGSPEIVPVTGDVLQMAFSDKDKWDRDRGLFSAVTRKARGVGGLDMVFMDGAAAVVEQAPMPVSGPNSIGEAPTARPDVRIRSYFPETLYFNPAVITDDKGKADIHIDMADSITTWRLSAMASSLNGLLGSTTSPLKVFQDFFIDIDLPVALTQNDEASIPVAVYNYLPGAQKVELELTPQPWFELSGPAKQTLQIAGNSVKAVHYRIKVKQIGWHQLTVHAYGSKMNDAIRRDIEVTPDGERQEISINDRLEKSVTHAVTIPQNAIDGASNILVKVYPGVFSQIVEGMDSLLRMPTGCFEQTSSATYPNVLVLGYMRDTKQSTPEIQMKAEQYINLGYQRLVSYECKGGGFEWFGNDPANLVLTAYGLLEFADMAKVYDVDPALITRTQNFLLSKQSPDGSFTPDKGGIAEGAINRQTDEFRTTAYVLWALGNSGKSGDAVQKGLSYLSANWSKVDDPYALALAANAFLATPDGKNKCIDLCQKLADLHKKDDRGIFWSTPGNTAVSSTGATADIETTALATIALMQTGRYNDLVSGAMTFLIKSKDSYGTWGSTQATIFSLKALISSLVQRTQDVNAKVTVLINGHEAETFQLTPENSDVLRQVDTKKWVVKGENKVEIRFDGRGSSLYQIAGYYYTPWKVRATQDKELMKIDVSFDRTKLDTDDVVTSAVKVAYLGRGTANMIIVDLGTPPGFDVLAEDLDALVRDRTFQKYSLTGRQIIVYIEKLEAGKPLEFKYRMRAKFPVKAKTPKSEVYQYYNPDARAVAAPVDMEVRG